MKQKLLFAAATAALMAAPSLAAAQDSGWYLRGNAGYGIHTDTELSGGLVGDNESEGNVAGSLGIGYEFANDWRLELDGQSLWTDLGGIDSLPNSAAKLRTNSLMLNAIYDFDDFGNWEPYVGAGVGLVRAQLDAEAHDFPSSTGPGGVLVASSACPGPRSGIDSFACGAHTDDTSVGWQVLAGLGYKITDNLSWDTHYKYQDFADLQFDGNRTNLGSNAISAFQTDLAGVGSHSLLTGFRYRFGGATPPPPPPALPVEQVADVACWDGSLVFNANQCPAEPRPEPTVRCWDGSTVFSSGDCPAQPETFTCPDGTLVYDLDTCPTRTTALPSELCAEQYRQEIIYYEFDKGQSAETRNTINRILDIGQFCNVENIRVVGHTDSSGSAAYNLALSKRRAKDARDELVRQGVNGSTITSDGKGETELFVQTGDGVKEQLNRRTEVLITLGALGAQSFTN